MRQDDPAAGADRDESLSEAFRAVARRLRQVSVASLARWDLTPSQFRALRVLLTHGALRPSELSERLRIAPRSTTEVLDGLETKGLVERGPDPGDRRATLVVPTERGTEVGAKAQDSRGTDADAVFGRLDPADRAELGRILRQLLD